MLRPDLVWPAASTFGKILSRAGLTSRRERGTHHAVLGTVLSGDGSESAVVHGPQGLFRDRRRQAMRFCFSIKDTVQANGDYASQRSNVVIGSTVRQNSPLMQNGEMDAAHAEIEPRHLRIARGYEAYKADVVRLANRNLAGYKHIVATRRGVFAVAQTGFLLIAHGFFFGITFRDGNIYLFEACDQPPGPTIQGRIIALTRRGEEITEARVVASGLDNGCHQIDFIDDRLHVLDTYNQKIIRFTKDLTEREVLAPLPLCTNGRWSSEDLEYRHVNSLLSIEDRIFLLLHNSSRKTGRSSELAVYSKEWQPMDLWTLKGKDCHSLAVLEDGSLLVCGSGDGDLISADGFRVHLAIAMTRGLSVGRDSIVVGVSPFVAGEHRSESRGSLMFLDRSFNKLSTLKIPGAPTEVRRLDGEDSSLSSYVQRVGLGRNLRKGRSSGEF